MNTTALNIWKELYETLGEEAVGEIISILRNHDPVVTQIKDSSGKPTSYFKLSCVDLNCCFSELFNSQNAAEIMRMNVKRANHLDYVVRSHDMWLVVIANLMNYSKEEIAMRDTSKG